MYIKIGSVAETEKTSHK